ncbi:flagellar biosynthesis regulatory protein FlaF [Roseovarius spongiae]|uniref:Flagellar biosynthesis regulatory protein FlaF n=1 Tax=Roseovarius spongiae TaxID=2320272 RepID=A0A3A8AR13_9RHOB|nr:flagellar biosynthesis regulator FlaF [Roseovarius spongiae]RKF13053.1 flagellar biosynthesis regulatory protein FlaF [Roseovarius spongiae]
MNAIRQAQDAYSRSARTIKTPRSAEYEAFARVTNRIRSSAGSGSRGFARLADALHDNRRLWTLLATDVADDANPLPPEIRARIVYLAEFTHLHSSRVLTEGASPAPLIEINTAVMGGLRERGREG